MMNMDKLTKQLTRHEAYRKHPYHCSKGYLTVAIGRNLESKGISRSEAEFMLANDIDEAMVDAEKYVGPAFLLIDEVRQAVVINLAFNMGLGTLKKFKKLREALIAGDYIWAAAEMKDSAWYNQVGRRGKELVKQMRTGEWQF